MIVKRLVHLFWKNALTLLSVLLTVNLMKGD